MQLSPLFTDGCVLVRGKDIRLFGQASPGDIITCDLCIPGKPALHSKTCTNGQGFFLLHMGPAEAATDCTLHFVCKNEEITVQDVAIGDVFLAGGQSNMELALRDAQEGMNMVQQVDDPLLRYFHVPRNPLPTPEGQALYQKTRWTPFLKGNGADMSAVSCFFALKARSDRQVPIGIIDCWWGGTSISCWMDEATLQETEEGKRYLDRYTRAAGGKSMETYLAEEKVWESELDAWNRACDALRQERPGIAWQELSEIVGPCPWHPPIGPGSPYRPCGLYEYMVKPLCPVGLSGILFYQGETDADQTEHYDILLRSMILLWRRQLMDPTLPFLNVQLPMWMDQGAEHTEHWPRLRMAQERVFQELRHTGLAVLIDLGEYNQIHPTNKRPVGERLYEQAKIHVYHEKGLESPRPVSVMYDGERITAVLSEPLVPSSAPADLFEVRDQDGTWHPAPCRIEGDRLVVFPPVKPATGLRYAYIDYATVHLFSACGLPLAPFETHL
ncbi:MAG: hypothetical protein IJ083_04250 [Clostridia bacterium]|nr:hypothetical protein [Clostridia bacterium]